MPVRLPTTGNFTDLTGRRFGNLSVLRLAGTHARYGSLWIVKCKCGSQKKMLRSNLRRAESCGCLKRDGVRRRMLTHGMSRTPEFAAWQNMLYRCDNPSSKAFPDYGGRGITVCKRWRKFENFFADMGKRPPGLTLDRKNNNGGYSKRNCRWATRKEQSNNQRNGWATRRKKWRST